MIFYFINGRNLAILPLDSPNMTSITNAYIIWWRILGRAKRQSRATNSPQQSGKTGFS